MPSPARTRQKCPPLLDVLLALKQRKQSLFAKVLEQGDAATAAGGSALTADDFRFLIEP